VQIVHRYVLSRRNASARTELGALGIEAPAISGQDSFHAFTVAEDDPRWPAVAVWATRHEILTTQRTKFSTHDLDEASWLCLSSKGNNGYPQPHDDFGYLAATYDLTHYCDRCGTGNYQNAPFRLRGEPRWGKRTIFSIHWVYDQFFVRPDYYTTIFEPIGFAAREVLSRGGRRLTTVVQLVIENEVPVAADGYPYEPDCPACGRRKYLPIVRGNFPAPLREPTGVAARTREWFGSGGSARREVLVPQAVRQALVAAGVRGLDFVPCGPRAAPQPIVVPDARSH
jgi:hypothetical protein